MIHKRFLAVVMSLLICAVSFASFTGCNDTPKQSVTITLSQTSATMLVGEELTLTATVKGSKEKVEWSSSDENVATVDQNGKVEAVGVGTCKITAAVGTVKAECSVTVNEREPYPTLVLSKDSLELKVGQEFQLTVTCLQGEDEITGLTYSFSSSDQAIATVDNQGKIKGISEGEAVITVSATVHNQPISAQLTVTVVMDIELRVDQTEIDLTLLELHEEDRTQYALSVELWVKGQKSEAPLTFESSDENVFTVDSEGVLTAVGVGEAILTISASVGGNKVTREIPITVYRTFQTEFTANANSYSNAMVNKAVTGYSNSQQLSIDVSPYTAGLDIQWTVQIGANLVDLTVQSDKRTASVTAKENTLGGPVKIVAKVENSSEIAFEFTVYNPICTEEDLYGINKNATSAKEIPGYYLLTNDIVCENNDPNNMATAPSGLTYYLKSVIGRLNTWVDPGDKFVGVFDGNGYRISNIRLHMNQYYNGLFGYNKGTIRNLEVEIATWDYGSGFNNTTLRRISGGVAGINEGTIENCYVKTDLAVDNVDNNVGRPSGGIAGYQCMWYSQTNNCFAEVGAVKNYTESTQFDKVGALVGQWANGSMNNCWALITRGDPTYASYIDAIAKKDDYGTVTDYGVASALSELEEAGFDITRYDANIWQFDISDGELTVSLIDGCTLKANVD